MSKMNVMPPVGTKGLYVLKPPYDALLKPANIYECGAIRYFRDLENNGSDIYKTYYQPQGLAKSDYEDDLRDGIVLVTLLSKEYPPVYVPSSYIKSYPSSLNKPYNQVIMSASLGALPDDVILDTLAINVADIVSDVLGVEVKVNYGIVPLSDIVTPEEHESREAARLGAISMRDTDYAKLKAVQDQNAVLKQRNAILEQIIIDKGLLP